MVAVFSHYILEQCRFKKLVALGLVLSFISSQFSVALAAGSTSPAAHAGQAAHANQATQNHPATHANQIEHFSPEDSAFVSKFLKSHEYIPTADIKPGMEGYGLSVFQGTKVEKFQVKVIGVIKKVLSGRDAILVRCSGAVLGRNNVVRGMSGSPIYINGKLAGALSYGFDFSKEPIVGVTPVADMLEALSFDDRPGASDRKVSYRMPARSNVIEASRAELARFGVNTAFKDTSSGASHLVPEASFTSSGNVRMVPLMAPVSLAGFSPRAQEFLKDKFKDCGLAISSGVSGALESDAHLEPETTASTSKQDVDKVVAAAEAGTVKLVPGGAVAVMLSTGDFSSSATGTATCIFGTKVIAFGHAFMDSGQVAFPMATAFVHDILPSLSVSFKLSSPLQVIGTVFADRPWSVGGEIGRYSQLIPLTINVTDEYRRVKKVYHCKIVDHPELTPGLVTATLMSALDATYQSNVPYVVKLNSTIDVKDHGRLKRTDRFAANFPAHQVGDPLSRGKGMSDPVSGFFGTIVDRLMTNDIEKAKISGLAVDVLVEDGRRISKIDRISLDRAVVAPGETVNVNVVMKPFSRPSYTEKMSFVIPRDLPDGDIAIGISGGDELRALRKRLGIVDPEPETINQIIERISRKERGDTLCGVMALPNQSVSFSGDILKNPPAHWLKLFFSDRSTKVPSLVKGEERTSTLLDDLVDGTHIIAVSVKRPDKVFAKSPPFTVSATQAANPADGIHITEQARKTIDSGRKIDNLVSTATAGGTVTSTVTSTASAPSSQVPTSPKETSVSGAQTWSQAQAFPHMRAINMWRQDTEENFRNGKTDGVAIDSLGRLTPGYRQLSRHTLDEEPRIWSSTFARDKFYFAAGSKIMSVSGEAAPVLVAELPGMLVSSMASDSEGNIYAASTPGGQIYIIPASGAAQGTAKPFVKLSEPIVSALCCDNSGHLFAGVSGSGKVYRISGGAASVVFDSNQAHITALTFVERENKVYVGTAEKGCVYSIDSDLKVNAEFETGEHIVTGIAKDKHNNLYVTTAGAGKLFRVQANGQSDAVASSEAFYTIYYDSRDDRVYSGDAEGDITRVEIEPLNDQAQFIPVCHTEQEAVMALATDKAGRLYCGTSNVAQVRSFQIHPSGDPSYSSIVYDSQRSANWSRVRLANINDDDRASLIKGIVVETRGGETSQPDQAWSPWVVAPVDGDGYLVKSGSSRFIQYKLTWKGSLEAKDARDWRNLIVSRVDITYQPTNAAPVLASLSVKAGDAFSGSETIIASGTDADQDNMLLSLDYSDDDGKSWKTAVADLRSRPSEAEKAKRKAKDAATKEAAKQPEKESGKESVDKKTVEKKDSVQKTDDKKPDDKKIDEKKPEAKKSNAGSAKQRKLADESAQEPDSKPDAGEPDANSNAKDAEAKEPDLKEAEKVEEKADGKTSAAAAEKSKDVKADVKSKKTEAEAATKASEQYSPTEKFTYLFDTKKIKDGQYLMRFKLSDKPSNPEHEKSIVVLRPVVIDNTPPQITDLKISKSERGLSIKLTAQDSVSYISDATYKIDDKEAFAFAPISAPDKVNASAGASTPLSDARTAVLSAEHIELEKGARKVTIQVFDRAGNSIKKVANLP